ncbi:MAG: DNA mismatch repair endonuclease MutL [Eubacteriales bacterium]|nr:DNA mismatch repair endonuclease MutL [Eubacteriales bacterium]
MGIELLDQNTINKIAAGEVIERPSSVVKELVENAIDAGATAITVEIKEGGISFIRVTDNGCGINKDEIEVAFKRHATSKIKSIEDLMSVSSLGFRGEALASISAVSQVELITKTVSEITAARYVCEGGSDGVIEEIGAPDGTTFIVRNLFFNTPVRRKFLKSSITEAGYINNLMQELALSHPDISFRFISNNQNKLHTSGNMNLKDIIYNVYGRDITSNLYNINCKTQDIEITGFIGKPFINRGNRTYENYFINGRYIRSNIISSAIEEAYKGFIMPHNYPFTVIHFNINPEIMDVNVHPTKMELRFSNNEYVYNFVYDSVLSTLKEKELATNVTPDSSLQTKIENAVKKDAAEPVIEEKNAEEKTVEIKTAEIKKLAEIPKKQSTEFRLPEPFEIKRSEAMVAEETATYKIKESESNNEQMSLFQDKLLDPENEQKYRIIGQLFETYWLIEFEDKFYMMDQHAAHEKILFEETMERLNNRQIDTQMIMVPVILTLNMMEEETLLNNMDAFRKMGYEIESFGGNEYKVTGVPAGFPKMDYKQLLFDVLDGLMKEGKKGDLDIITEKVASMSCKAAIKGNNRISFQEAEELIKKLMKAKNPYNCPHGRPTLIVMSKYDIERKFKRIV